MKKNFLLISLLCCSLVQADSALSRARDVEALTLASIIQLSKERVSLHDTTKYINLSSGELFEYLLETIVTTYNKKGYKHLAVVLASTFIANRLLEWAKEIGHDSWKTVLTKHPNIKKTIETVTIAYIKNLSVECGKYFKESYL